MYLYYKVMSRCQWSLAWATCCEFASWDSRQVQSYAALL